MKNNRDRTCIYILDQEEKRKLFGKKVCPSAKLLYTKTQERVKITDCGLFCLKCVYWESNARRLTKIKPNEIFNDLVIPREPIDEYSTFFCFKVMD